VKHSLKRLVVGAAVAGATIAAAPAIASASSTCTFDTNNHQVVIMDGSGSGPLVVSRNGGNITYADDFGEPQLCVKGVNVAGVSNTTSIYVQGPVVGASDGYFVDESNGTFLQSTPGNPEIKFDALTTGGGSPVLWVHGTAGNDHMIMGAKGKVDLNGDLDTDVTIESNASRIIAYGGAGNDTLDGSGYTNVGPTTIPESLHGGDGNDVLTAGRQVNELVGDVGDDEFNSYFNGYKDNAIGGPGYDRSFRDAFDTTDAEYDVIAH